MHLSRLQVVDFRNYCRVAIKLPPGVVVIHGPNGAGKTSLLEAVCVLATGDSPRARTTGEMVRAEREHAYARATFAGASGARELEVGLSRAGQRQVKIGGSVRRRRDLIGVAPVVLFWAADIETLRGEPSGRRRWLDRELSAVSRSYDHHLVRYRRALEQRNRLLKSIRERRAQEAALDPWDRAVARHGADVMVGREKFVWALASQAVQAHEAVTGDRRSFALAYNPSLRKEGGQSAMLPEEDYRGLVDEVGRWLLAALGECRGADIAYGRTSVGPHRDDVDVMLDGRPVKTYGSQGEQRSCAVAMRLALAHVAEEMTGEKPVLLLDDVLSELDERHRSGVFEACRRAEQVIVTCCDEQDIPRDEGLSCTRFAVAGGEIV